MQNPLAHHVVAPTDHFFHHLQRFLLRKSPFLAKIVIQISIRAVLCDNYEFFSNLFLVEFEYVRVFESFQYGYFVVDEFLAELVAVELGVNDLRTERLALAAHRLEHL